MYLKKGLRFILVNENIHLCYTRNFPTQGVALVALALSRAANVWPCTSMVNYFRPPELRIPPGQQLMIWFSGMRGAMAFAMALRALEELSRALPP